MRLILTTMILWLTLSGCDQPTPDNPRPRHPSALREERHPDDPGRKADEA